MKSTKEVTVKEFTKALRAIGKPGGKVALMLSTHAKAPARAMTVSNIAKAIEYKEYRGVNLQYGRLAVRIGEALGRRDVGMDLLVEFIPPKSQTNEQWLLRMKERFAISLERADWI